MDEAKATRIVGKPDGWESDHFMLCPVCGEMLDMRRLDQALAHWHDRPEPEAARIVDQTNGETHDGK